MEGHVLSAVASRVQLQHLEGKQGQLSGIDSPLTLRNEEYGSNVSAFRSSGRGKGVFVVPALCMLQGTHITGNSIITYLLTPKVSVWGGQAGYIHTLGPAFLVTLCCVSDR